MRRLGWFLNEHDMWQARPWLVWVLRRVFGLGVIPSVSRRVKSEMQKFYHVNSLVSEFGGYKNVDLDWFVNKREWPLALSYSKLITGYDQSEPSMRIYAESAVEEMFTLEEATALLAWLNKHRVGKHSMKKAKLPIKSNTMGISCIPIGGPQDFLAVWKSKDWDLPFQAEAYFDLRHHDRLAKDELLAEGAPF
jgi:hypothetical protein